MTGHYHKPCYNVENGLVVCAQRSAVKNLIATNSVVWYVQVMGSAYTVLCTEVWIWKL